MSKCPNLYGSKVGRVSTRFKAIQYNLVILFIFLAVFGIGQALRGVKGDGEFRKGDFMLLDNHDIWPGSCV